jgi:hypothetical protein
VFEGRAAIGFDHGYDAQKFYLRLALDPKYVEGFVEGCLERMGEEDPEDASLGTCGRTRARGKRCSRYCMPSARSCRVDPRTTFLTNTKSQTSLQKLTRT